MTAYDTPLWTKEDDRISRRYKAPGADVCPACPFGRVHFAWCYQADAADDTPAKLRQSRKAPRCPYAYAVWRLRHIEPAEAKKIADRAARETLAKGVDMKWYRKRIDVIGSRMDFVAGLKERAA